MAKHNVTRQLEMTPWELIQCLRKAGVIKTQAFMPHSYEEMVKMHPKTEVNEGRTVVITWGERQEHVDLEGINKEGEDNA